MELFCVEIGELSVGQNGFFSYFLGQLLLNCQLVFKQQDNLDQACRKLEYFVLYINPLPPPIEPLAPYHRFIHVPDWIVSCLLSKSTYFVPLTGHVRIETKNTCALFFL